METINSVLTLIVSVTYLVGLYLALIEGVYGFWAAQNRERGTTNREAAQSFVVGCMLLIIPTIYSVVKATTIAPDWDGAGMSALALDQNIDIEGVNGGSFFGKFIPAETMLLLVGFVYVIGLFAFISGVYHFKYAGLNNSMSNQSGGSKKAAIRMMGGVLVMNITTVGCWFLNLVGLSMLCGG